MWAPLIHLLVGNLIIAVVEGCVLGRILKVGIAKAVGIMIAANYASSLIGVFTVPRLGEFANASLAPATLFYYLPQYLCVLALTTFLATIIVEWPFCFSLIRRRPNAASKSLLATAAVHVLSYAALVWFYLSASDTTLYTELEASEELVPSLPATAEVLFLSPEDGDLYRIRLNGSDRRIALSLDGSHSDLHAQVDTANDTYRIRGWSRGKSVDLGFVVSAEQWRAVALEARTDLFGEAWDFREETERGRTVRMGYWARQGLIVSNAQSRVAIGLEVPTVAWRTRNATVLPGDLVVYQLGDQIVVLDLESRRLGFLASGRSPLVLLKEKLNPIGLAR